jgi:Mrp family chromosome partitioning ATPase
VARASAAGRDAVTFLASPDFGPFVDLARRRFGAVLFHASPLPTAVGGLIAARHCDHVVLSVGEGVPLASVRRAVDQLRGVNAHVLGVVLERQSRRREGAAKGSRI